MQILVRNVRCARPASANRSPTIYPTCGRAQNSFARRTEESFAASRTPPWVCSICGRRIPVCPLY
jgi:hypothetical protein